MEKLPHQEYRDELAYKLKDIRNSDPETGRQEAQEYLEGEQNSEEYKKASKLHREDIESIIENKNVDEKIKLAHIAEGDRFFSQGTSWNGYNWAILEYKKADAKEKIRIVADAYVKDGYYSDAKKAYEDAGIEIPKDKLIECADAITKRDNVHIPLVFKIYKEAGANDKLIEYAETILKHKYVDDERLNLIFDAYESTGNQEKLKEAGEWLLNNLNVGLSTHVYERCGIEIPREKLIEVGRAGLIKNESGKGYEIINAFRLAGAPEELVMAGDTFLQRGDGYYANEAYLASGIEIPKEKWEAVGDALLSFGLRDGSWGNAREVYRRAGLKDKLKDLGDLCISSRGDLFSGLEMYKLAEVDVTKELLMEIGDRLAKDGRMDKAVRAYEMAKEV